MRSVAAALVLFALEAHAVTRLVEPLVSRAPTLLAGQGTATFGAGAWLRSGPGALTIGHVDLRYGLTNRVELRMLLPGITFTAGAEEGNWPAILLYGGLVEVGFATDQPSVLAYHAGVAVSKRLHRRLRLKLGVEVRQRAVGAEAAELSVPGPLPPSIAAVGYGELAAQAVDGLAFLFGLGHATALNDEPSVGFASLSVVATLAQRIDLFAQVWVHRSRGAARYLDPAYFAGTTLHY